MNFGQLVRDVKSGAISLAKQTAKMIAYVSKLDDTKKLKECKAQAAAVLEYLVHHKDSSVIEHNSAVAIKASIEHRLGEVLAMTVKHKGLNQHAGNGVLPPEISKMTSSRSQQLAKIPWKEIAAKIDEKTRNNEKASQARIVKELMQEKQREENAALVEEAEPLSEIPNDFQTIVIDPPWDWDDEGDETQLGRARHEYKAMSIEELHALPVDEHAKDNAHIYLWITNRSLPKGFALLESWGFRYVTCLTWCKPSFGMGNYFRGSTEHVLFGIRGSLPLLKKNVGTWFEAKRAGKHSAKPDEFFKLVESCSPGPWLEMFARKTRPGWVAWGAEVNE